MDTPRINPNLSFLSYDTILLLVLVLPHLWFNSASSAVMIILLAVYIGLDLRFPRMADELPAPRAIDRWVFTIRMTIVLFAIMMAVLLPTSYNIARRHSEGPGTHANDGMLQIEASIQFLLEGKNPYVENYLNTPMAELWKNPLHSFSTSQLYHNAYLPLLFIGSIPFYWLSYATIGWYDERFVFLIIYFFTLILMPQLVQGQRKKLMLLIVFGLNVLFSAYLEEGRNDIVISFGLLLTTALLARRHVTWSAVVLGLTCATKHLAWFFLPFYFSYLLPEEISFAAVRRMLVKVLPVFLVPLAIIAPFIIWDWQSFLDDTFFYLIGSGPNSFPIQGWGFSSILFWLGIVPNAEAAFPFSIFELLFGIPTLFLLLRVLRQKNTISQMWFGFAVLSFMIEFFSRFFNDNYFVFLLQVLLASAFMIPFHWKLQTANRNAVVAHENVHVLSENR